MKMFCFQMVMTFICLCGSAAAGMHGETFTAVNAGFVAGMCAAYAHTAWLMRHRWG